MAYIVLLYQISTNCIKSHPSLFKNLHAGFVIRLSCSQYMSATYKMWMPVEHLTLVTLDLPAHISYAARFAGCLSTPAALSDA